MSDPGIDDMLHDDSFRRRIAAALRQLDQPESDAEISAALDAVEAEPIDSSMAQRILNQVCDSIAIASNDGTIRSHVRRAPSHSNIAHPAQQVARPETQSSQVAIVVTCFSLLLIVAVIFSQFGGIDRKSVATNDRESVPLSQQLIAAAPPPNAHDGATSVPRATIGETLTTGPREKQRVTLPDGSILSMNEKTTVTIVEPRRIKLLSGEVFVEVIPTGVTRLADAADTNERFIVETASRQVTALGTKFVVKAQGQSTTVVVTQGKVQVSGVAQVIAAGQELIADLTESSSVELKPARRSAYVVEWVKDLMAASSSLIVPASEHSGGTITVIDPQGQEMKLSLRKFHVDVHIEDGFARTTIDQTYFNHTWQQLEGTFRFPLPADASLSRLAMYVNGTLMEGGMVERDYGRNVFEQIRHTRRDPALLEWVDGSTFQMRVFPLEARQEKRILLSYTQRLPNDYGKTTYRFPAGHNLDGVREWSTHVRVKGGAGTTWHSPSHLLDSRSDGSDLIVDGREEYATMEQDLVLELGDGTTSAAVKSDQIWSRYEQDGFQYLMLRLRPELISNVARSQRHWVFLIENSADRNTILAETQRQIAKVLLENSEHSDTFSIVRAGTQPDLFRDKPMDCSVDNVAAALDFVKEVAPIGALDFSRALESVQQQVDADRETWIVHLGTGIPVLGERDHTTLIRRLPSKARYIGVAVGKRWSKSFMETAAKQTGGSVVQINPDEAVAWRAFDLLSTLNAPRLTEINISASAMELEKPDASASQVEFLRLTNSVSHGQELAAVARLPIGNALPKSIVITGKLNGDEYSQAVTVPATLITAATEQAIGSPDQSTVISTSGHLPRTWARLEIDRLVSLGSTENRAQIIELSKSMYVMSPFTSLLVLETEAMYEQFKVDRGRKDHWALYAAPAQIPVVADVPTTQLTTLDAAKERLKQAIQRAQTAEKNYERSVLERRPTIDLKRLERVKQAELADVISLEAEIQKIERANTAAADPVRKAWESVIQRRVAWQQGFVPQFTSFNGRRYLNYWGDMSLYSDEAQLKGIDANFDLLYFNDNPTYFGASSRPVNDSGALFGRRGGLLHRNVFNAQQASLTSAYYLDDDVQYFPAADVWKAVTERRRKWDNVALKLDTPQSQRVRRELKNSTEVNFTDIPLKDALDYLEELHHIQIWVDERALSESGISGDQTINLNQSGESLDRTLGRMLNPLQLTVVVEDEYLKITTKAAVDNESAARAYQMTNARLTPEYIKSGGMGSGWGGGQGLGVFHGRSTGGGFLGIVPNMNQSLNWAEPTRWGRPQLSSRRVGIAEPQIEGATQLTYRNRLLNSHSGNVIDLGFQSSGLLPVQVGNGSIAFDYEFAGNGIAPLYDIALEQQILADGLMVPSQRVTYVVTEGLDRGTNRAYRLPIAGGFSTHMMMGGDTVQYYVAPHPFADLIQDLPSYAPGLQTWTADRLAVAEQATDRKPTRGTIDPEARRLIEKARSLGWESIRLESVNQFPARDHGTLIADGAGRFKIDRQVSESLNETVINDGTTLWHLYPEIALGAKRSLNRFHQSAIQSLIPWYVPSADELTLNGDVTLVGERTVRISTKQDKSQPTEKAKVQDASAESASKRLAVAPSDLAIELVFAVEGQLIELRLLDARSNKLLAKQTIAHDGTIRLSSAEDKLLAEARYERSAVQPPDLAPVIAELVVLPLPYRSTDSVGVEVPMNLQTNTADFNKLSDEDALRLLATYFAEARQSELATLIEQRFAARGDHRIGLAVLLASVAPQNPIVTNATNHHPDSSLAKYLELFASCVVSGNGSGTIDVGAKAPPFLIRLCGIYNINCRWSADLAVTRERPVAEIEKELDEALRFVVECRSLDLTLRLLATIQDGLKRVDRMNPTFARQLNIAAAAIASDRELPAIARPARIEWLLIVGDAESERAALTLFRAQLFDAIDSGLVPDLSTELRSAFVKHFHTPDGQTCQPWADLVKEAARMLSTMDRPVSLIAVARRCLALGETALAKELSQMAIKNQDAKPNQNLNLATLEYAKEASDWSLAEVCVKQALNDADLQKRSSLWRDAAKVAHQRQKFADWIDDLEKAYEIEFVELPKTVNLENFRKDYDALFVQLEQRTEQLADANRAERESFAKIIQRATTRWREIDSDDTNACHRAARMLTRLGQATAAWNYWTTPLAAAPDRSTAWMTFANAMLTAHRFLAADNAWTTAFECEPTNPEILLEHAKLLHSTKQEQRARALLTTIVTGNWQPRFEGTKAQAQSILSGQWP